MDGQLVIASAALRRVPQQARSRERLEHILRVADRLMAESGPEALTTSRVAAAAGISVGSLYQYLPDREAIIEALAESYLRRLEDAMRELAERARARRWPDPIAELVDVFAELYRSAPGFRALWFSRHLTDATRAADREHKKRMAVTLAEVLLAQRVLPDIDRLANVCYAGHVIADAALQEAFRLDPDGDPDLLRETKTALRGYVAAYTREVAE
ncbi:TetR/AcrR family transcriptional regulator [Nocardia sp. NPDC005745]|uniref:TetR/AcrR family transcriptional regulator n=1 Tax=Nocardia sp. NPDC005745 TaxID=3157061 RepID=UPI0033FFF997